MKKNKFKKLMISTLILFFLLLIFNFIDIKKTLGVEINLNNPPVEQGLPGYIKWLFVAGISIVGAIALIMITYGAIRYITSAANPAMKGEAKDIINKALIGLGLLLISYILLYTINPDLVNLKSPSISVEELKKAAEQMQKEIKLEKLESSEFEKVGEEALEKKAQEELAKQQTECEGLWITTATPPYCFTCENGKPEIGPQGPYCTTQ